VGRRCLLLA